VSKRIVPGMRLPSGRSAEFAIRLVRGDWWIFYDDTEVGYFPGALWNGTYTSAQMVTAFGEVAENTTDVPSCTQMGDGRFGSDHGSSWIAGFHLYGSTDAPDLTVLATSPDYYGFGKATPTSFRLGGPGKGACH
jgi:hypothetical protein